VKESIARLPNVNRVFDSIKKRRLGGQSIPLHGNALQKGITIVTKFGTSFVYSNNWMIKSSTYVFVVIFFTKASCFYS
jgi:hypothetical protein